MRKIISIDQSTQSTKAFLFSSDGKILSSSSRVHEQYYPAPGFVEHNPMDLYLNTLAVIKELLEGDKDSNAEYSLAITNQRETVVVWNKISGEPISNAVVWQDVRGKDLCKELIDKGCEKLVNSITGLCLDPYFSASGAAWLLNNIPNARELAQRGDLLMGTVDSWLIWKLTKGEVHATDYTNASRTLLFDIHKMEWSNEMLELFNIPASMMPKALPCDAKFGETDLEGYLSNKIEIAGVIGDSHGALVGQMCFTEGLAKATFGTGSSVMVNIGEKYSDAPAGLVTSIAYAANGKVFYGFEGNIHCTGMTITWLEKELGLISHVNEVESLAQSVPSSEGVYLVPAFAGLGAPWWRNDVRAMICGLTLGSGKAHICRAALESIAYQITDLVEAMTKSAGISLKELRVDGGPTKNRFLMQLQSNLLRVPITRSEVMDASAFGAFVVNSFAFKESTTFEQATSFANFDIPIVPNKDYMEIESDYNGWKEAIALLTKKN